MKQHNGGVGGGFKDAVIERHKPVQREDAFVGTILSEITALYHANAASAQRQQMMLNYWQAQGFSPYTQNILWQAQQQDQSRYASYHLQPLPSLVPPQYAPKRRSS